jgi:hypothetical protein
MIYRFGRWMPWLNVAAGVGAAGSGAPSGTPPAGENGQSGNPPATGDGGGQGGGAPPGAPAVKTFTQEEVNRLTGQARDEGRRSASKAPDGTPPKPEGQQQTPAAPAPDYMSVVQQAVAQALQAAGVDPFTIAARQAGYSDAQIHLARAAHDAAKPPELGKWLAEWPTQVGLSIKQNGGTGAPTPAASTGGAPRKVEDMRDEAGLVDVFSLPPETVMAMGPARIREEFEKVLDRHRQTSGAPPIPSALRRK